MKVPKRILIINPFGIGDVLFSTPLIRALRCAFPHAYLAYLCNRRTKEILQRNAHLDELFVYEKDDLIAIWKHSKRRGLGAVGELLDQIRRRRFDLALDLSMGERYSFLLAVFGVPRRIGFGFRRRGRFLTHRLTIGGYEDQHVVEYYVQLLNLIGVCMLDRQLELGTNDEDRRTAAQRIAQLRRDGQVVIGLVPAGGISWGLHAYFRRWSEDGFIQVGRRLSEQYGAAIVVFGESKDRAVCAKVAHAIGSEAVDLSGQTTLGEFVSLISQCDLVISNDGGPIHIAASQGVPTISIFGPVDPRVYGPYPHSVLHRLIYKADLPCRPCYRQFKLPPCPYQRACLTDLNSDDVLEACEKVLATHESRLTSSDVPNTSGEPHTAKRF